MDFRIIITLIILFIKVNFSFAACHSAHTHIGVNPTWRPDWSDPGNPEKAADSDLTDDNKLWLFSIPPVHPLAPTPGWPNWEQANGSRFLQLVPVLNDGNPIMKGDASGKQLWTCSFTYSQSGGHGDPSGLQHLNGWASAHGPQGKWNLSSIDQSTVPMWDIHLKRESTSVEEGDFFMLLPDDTAVLTGDSDTLQLGKEWLADTAWGIHEHISFNFWLMPDIGREVTATFSVFDAGGVYSASDNYDFAFVTVPEPSSLMLLGLGVISFLRNKK